MDGITQNQGLPGVAWNISSFTQSGNPPPFAFQGPLASLDSRVVGITASSMCHSTLTISLVTDASGADQVGEILWLGQSFGSNRVGVLGIGTVVRRCCRQLRRLVWRVPALVGLVVGRRIGPATIA